MITIMHAADLVEQLLLHVYLAAFVLNCWSGTHDGAIRAWHLDAYLDEFAFCCNHQESGCLGLLFCYTIRQSIAVKFVSS